MISRAPMKPAIQISLTISIVCRISLEMEAGRNPSLQNPSAPCQWQIFSASQLPSSLYCLHTIAPRQSPLVVYWRHLSAAHLPSSAPVLALVVVSAMHTSVTALSSIQLDALWRWQLRASMVCSLNALDLSTTSLDCFQ